MGNSILLIVVGIFVFNILTVSQQQEQGTKKNYRDVSPAEVKQRLEEKDSLMILDVRTKEEYESSTGHLPGAILIPIQELEKRYHELDSFKDKEIVAYCRSGHRSSRASQFLGEKGFKMLNLKGGILEWNKLWESVLRKESFEPSGKDESSKKVKPDH